MDEVENVEIIREEEIPRESNAEDTPPTVPPHRRRKRRNPIVVAFAKTVVFLVDEVGGIVRRFGLIGMITAVVVVLAIALLGHDIYRAETEGIELLPVGHVVEYYSLDKGDAVESYDEMIRDYAERYGMKEYVELIKAVMAQESYGQGDDPMQASACGYNKRFSGSIRDPEYSIECGVQYLRDCMQLAGVVSHKDVTNIKLALQGYNYGVGYIQWALEQDGGYTRANALQFSDNMKQKSGRASYGDPDYVPRVLRYYADCHVSTDDDERDMISLMKKQVGKTSGEVYCSWFGLETIDNWDACMISWCADQEGLIDTGTLPLFVDVESGIDWFRDCDHWKGKEDTPLRGNILFLDEDLDGTEDHVGIITEVKGEHLFSIELSHGIVSAQKHSLQDAEIAGYGVPLY